MDEEPRLRLIEGGNKPRKYRRRKKGDAEQWTCAECEADIGIATSGIVRMRLSPMMRGASIEGGTNVWVCAYCLARGKTTRCT